MIRILRAACAALAFALPLVGWAQTSVAQSCTWFGSNETWSQVPAGADAVVATVPIGDAVAGAVGAQDCGLWVLGKTELRRYDNAGALAARTALAALDAKLPGATRLAVDPIDGSLWIAGAKVLVHASPAGAVLARPIYADTALAVNVTPDQSLWVLGTSQVQRFSAAGALLATYAPRLPGAARQLAVDALRKVLWINTSKGIVRFAYGEAGAQAAVVHSSGTAAGIALDPLLGRLWVTDGGMLHRYEADGTQGGAVVLSGLRLDDPPLALGFDPAGRTLWVWFPDRVARFSQDGLLQMTFGRTDAGGLLALAPLKVRPVLSLVEPPADAITSNARRTISLAYDAECNGQPCGFPASDLAGYSLNALLNGQQVGSQFVFDAATRQVSYTPAASLPEGTNTLQAQARDGNGALSNLVSAQFTVDTVAPVLAVSSPANGLVTNKPVQAVSGSVNEPASVLVNDAAVSVSRAGTFTATVTLQEGANQIRLAAIDRAGNTGSVQLGVTLDTHAPAAPVGTAITVSTAVGGAVTVAGAAGAVEAGSSVVVSNARTGASTTVTAGADGAFSVQIGASGGDALNIAVRDAAGNLSPATAVNVGGGLPPDPATVAPPNDSTVQTRFGASIAFLYEGANPVQTGVAPGAIDAKRVAVLRGKVMTRSGQPLSGVTVKVLDHPEFGQTLSRDDGMFDMAANGGGSLTVMYARNGYLPVQRTLPVPWSDFSLLPDVLMTQLDSQVTQVDLSAQAVQVARGAPVMDAAGARQVTLMFMPGTTASLVMPDGSSQPLGRLNVRATEYTVGPEGPAAMPGTLPLTTHFTYAVEFSVDEAMSAGASSVAFSRPVPVYVDNFLQLPTGVTVPVGYYDQAKGAWVAAPNGRVVRVLGVAGGMASLDLAGAGQEATATELALFGITDAERTQLAALYAPGTSLWRVPVRHFTAFDFNWLVGHNSIPRPCDEQGSCLEPELDLDCDPCEQAGSVIEVQNQVLGERIPLAGTPFTLNYRSSRMPGFIAPATLRIPLTRNVVPTLLLGIDVEIQIAGQRIVRRFAPAPNLVDRYTWDGKDAYGRRMFGPQPVTLRIGYTYRTPMMMTAQTVQAAAAAAPAWGLPGDITGPEGRYELTLWSTFRTALDSPQLTDVSGLAGWSLSGHNLFETARGRVVQGDGRTRDAAPLAVDSYVQPLQPGRSYTALPHLAVDPAGSLWISGDTSTSPSSGLHRISPDGQLTTVGTQGGFEVAAAPNGDVFITGSVGIGRQAIFKVGPNGSLTPIAGYRFSTPTNPALQEVIFGPLRMAVDAEGSIYYSQVNQGCVVNKVTTAGYIVRVAGNGTCLSSPDQPNGDGGPATRATLRNLFNNRPGGMALDADGNLYIADALTVRKVRPDGVISTVAGRARDDGGPRDGRPATEAWLGATSGGFLQGIVDIAFHPSGDLIIAAFDRILRVGKDGIARIVAGADPARCSTAAGGAALNHCPTAIVAMSVDPAGRIFFLDSPTPATNLANAVLKKIEATTPALLQQEIFVASPDAATLDVFDVRGKHQRVLDARVGSTLLGVSYDAAGRLAALRDASGNETRIERAASGAPVAIVSPDGLRTALQVSPDGWLQQVTNPAGESYRMGYTPDGLLTSFARPSGAQSTFAYRSDGLLLKDSDAAGGSISLARTVLSQTEQQVDSTTALGRTTRFTSRRVGAVAALTVVAPDGSSTQTVGSAAADAQSSTSYADGTTVHAVKAPDPRFGMTAPIVSSQTIQLPGGLAQTRTSGRSVTFGSGSLLDLATETEFVSLNGRNYTRVFDAAQRRYTATTPLGRASTVVVDAQSRPVSSQLAGIEPVTYGYDARGRLASMSQGTGAQARVASLDYNPQGWLSSMRDPLGRTIGYQYDAAGRVTGKTLPDGHVIGFAYDANGNVTAVTPPGRPAHGFGYTPVDLQEQYNPPAVAGVGNPATRYAYNLDKQLTTITRPDGQTVQFGYDTGGRLSTVTTPTGVTGYAYTPAKGTLAGIAAPGGIDLAYTYDGFLLLSESWTGPVAGSIGRTYNNDFDLRTLNVAGTTYTFSYDNDRLLTGAGALTIGRDAASGFINDTQLGGVATSQSYNSFGEVQQYQAMQGGNTVFAQTYDYDKAGRIVQKLEQVQGQSDSYGYDYDTAGRLTTVSKNGAAITTYSYDANGNRTGDGSNQASYDAQDRLLQYGGATYSYTDNGELKSKKVGGEETRYDYDVLGNLRSVSLPDGKAVEYLIDGHNRRIGKKVNGALVQGLLYQNQLNPVAELDGAGAVRSRFVYGTKSNVPDYMERGGKTYRIVSDHLGSVRLVVDTATGEVAQRMDYDAFGWVIQDTNPGFQPFGFAGGIYDQDTRLTRFGARDYDSLTGRWTSKDPIGFDGGDTNLMGYVFNDPVNWIDPYGLQQIPDPNGVVPGGPWTPHDANRPGQFLGPKPLGGGGRAQCQYVPPEGQGGPPGSTGYWKTNEPGQKGWQRYDLKGNPISAAEAHKIPKKSGGGGGGGGFGGGGLSGGGGKPFNPFAIPYN